MKNAILVHGWNTHAQYVDSTRQSASNDHWFPWLTKQLMIRGYKVDVPEMTQHSDSTYESWAKEFERFDISDDTLLVGHSLGGGFLVRYLSEHPETRVGRVVLVAGWLGYDAEDYPEFNKTFFDFTIDKELINRVHQLHVMYSLDDDAGTTDAVRVLRGHYPEAIYHEYTDRGHFTRDSLGTEEFPELLAICTRR